MEAVIAVQILIERKGADPSATTAREAIRELLGLGDRLRGLRRRRLLELVIAGPLAVDAVRDGFLRYLDRTTLLWNPNKERAWVRTPEDAFEVAGGAARRGPFGHPALEEAGWDHVLVWNRDAERVPEDLASGLAPLRLLASGGGELWSAEWTPAAEGGPDPAQRGALTRAIGEVRTRGEGFLVNPHYQDHRILSGAVPLPLWGNA